MSSNDGEGRCQTAVRNRDTGVSWYCNRRGYSRHYLKRDAVLSQNLGFLTTPAQDKRVASLEPHHCFPFFSFCHQQLV